MTKKIHEKKKVNVKLESGETFLVASIEEMLQIANALVHLSSSTKDEKEKLKLIMLSEEAIKAINENQFISRNIGEDDEW
jgi:ssRNA-specific RNase YbeY (16S rRNA maturation enzyme)